MTFAVEPKIVFPGEGSVGIENTVVVTRDGCEILPRFHKRSFECEVITFWHVYRLHKGSIGVHYRRECCLKYK